MGMHPEINIMLPHEISESRQDLAVPGSKMQHRLGYCFDSCRSSDCVELMARRRQATKALRINANKTSNREHKEEEEVQYWRGGPGNRVEV